MDTSTPKSHRLSEQAPACAIKRCPAAKAAHSVFLETLFIISGCWIMLAVDAEVLAKSPEFEANQVIIVLDPGHGGSDSGAVGSNGTTEKAVALAVVQMIASGLGGDFTVVFTRLDDYQMEIEDRPAAANHQKADLFISVHAGGSFAQNTSGPTLYYYQHDSDPFLSRMANGAVPDKDPHAPIPWDLAQYPYLEDSWLLAKMVQAQIENLNSMKPCRLEGAPLAVLKGANMPAILIEVGYLTNPAEEKNLRNTVYLTKIAAAIAKGVRDFLEHRQR